MNDLLRPENLRSVAGLELAARRTVQTFLPGINPSRRTGTGQTFSQYRSYQPGDDLRRLDWKLYARSDRFFIREADLESNLTLRFVLDASASMQQADDEGLAKMDYARYLVATLAWLARQQGDALALHAVNARRWRTLRPRAGRTFFRRLLHELLQVEPEGFFPESEEALSRLVGREGPEMIVFISDLYEHAGELSDLLRQLSRLPHEVVLFQLVGRNELDLAYRGVVQFEEYETGRRLKVDPGPIRNEYRERISEHFGDLDRQMLDWGISYRRIVTDTLPGDALRAYLLRRHRSG